MKKLYQFLQAIHLFFFKSSKQYKRPKELFNICDKMQSARKVLFCFPNDPVAPPFAIAMIKDLQKSFASWHITVSVLDETNLPEMRGITILNHSMKDVSFYGLPKKVFLHNLFRTNYDIIVDLCLDYDFTNLALVWKSNVDLRVGFYQQKREDFYNFLLRQKEGATAEQAGQMLANTLKSI